MPSIYEIALGSDFHKLHPMMQKRLGFSSENHVASIGEGTMDRIWFGPPYTLPFLYIGTWRNIMFPQRGRDIPFRIENYAYRDELGRETVTWVRTFDFGRRKRRFEATMIYSEQRKRIVDYLGSHQHLAVDIDLTVSPNGGIRLRSGAQRFHEGPFSFNFPMAFSGVADVSEWFDDREGRYRIDVFVENSIWGPLFGYRGSFDAKFLTTTEIPSHVKPRRTEARD